MTNLNNRRIKPKILEKHVLKACLKYLSFRPGMWWRNNTGALLAGDNRFIRFGHRGSSDIIGLTPKGRFVAIECKGTGGVLSKEQKIFQEQVERNNGIYVLAYDVDDIVRGGL